MESDKHIENLARAAFDAHERVRAMEMMNTPTDYEERKLAFVELAKARAVAAETQKLLDRRVRT
jgi:hypothetical protein